MMIFFVKRRNSLLGLLLLVIATPGLSSDMAKPTAQVEWIRASASPLKTVEAGHGFDDMIPLQRVVGDARIIALGEVTQENKVCGARPHRKPRRTLLCWP